MVLGADTFRGFVERLGPTREPDVRRRIQELTYRPTLRV